MKLNKLQFLPSDNAFPFGGLDLVSPATQLEPGSSTNAVNVTTFRGSIEARDGNTLLSTLASSPVMKIRNFKLNSGTNLIVAFTPTQIFSSTNGTAWTDRTPTIAWTGDESNFIDVCEGTDIVKGRVMCAVNGKDAPLYWTGTGSKFIPIPVGLANFTTAKTVAFFQSYFVFANITTSVDYEPRTAAWSDTGDITNWTSGNSGVLSEIAVEGDILRLIPYTDKLVIISRESIGCLCYIDPDVIFGTQIYVQGIRVVGPAAVERVDSYIVYASQDNLYLWDGGRVVATLGDKVVPIWREARSSVYTERTLLHYDQTLGLIRWVVPTGASTSRILVVELETNSATFYDVNKSKKTRWFEHTYSYRPTAFGLTLREGAARDNLSLILGGSGGEVVMFGADYTLDNGSTFNSTWDSGDFVIPQIHVSQLARWLEIEFEAKGQVVLVYYSTDQGSTWILAASVTLGTNQIQHRTFIDTTARSLRVRFVFSSESPAFALAWMRVWYRPGGAR